MSMAPSPFLVALSVALLVLGAIVLSAHRRNEVQARAAPRGSGGSTGRSVLPAPVLGVALAVMLVPFGIAFAALWGPPIGFAAGLALLAGGLIAAANLRRRRGRP